MKSTIDRLIIYSPYEEPAHYWSYDRETRGIHACYDFSATPFAPSGKKSSEEALFPWIASDFGLNDAIESGLVKTPRAVIRDDGVQDAKDYRSRLYHIYEHVRDDLNHDAQEHDPLPDLVINGYYLLGKDWLETEKAWVERGFKTPPVMISVANRTETAAIEGNNSEQGQEDEPVRKLSRKEKAGLLRQKVDTVGQSGKPGELIQNVISVGMLSEGWDAKTVTHIMGLRAFSSQLLCEQVVGRGLRRTSYEINPDTGLFDAEYVNIFGVPFTFLPHESRDGPPPPPPAPKTKIEPVLEKKQFEISWPNIIRIDHTYMPTLTLDMSKVSTLELNAAETATLAELAPVVEGKPDFSGISEIDLNDLANKFRMQRIIFETARDIYDQMKPTWKGNREFLLAQLIQLVEEVIFSEKIRIFPQFFNQDDKKRRILITLNMNRVVHHIWKAIRFENTESITPVFNSTWEASEAFELDRNPGVESWVKNDHIGFEILYIFKGKVRKYRPDFIIRLKNGEKLILETKGQDTQQDKTKREFLDEWVKAVNQHGGFGTWKWSVSKDPADVAEILKKAGEA